MFLALAYLASEAFLSPGGLTKTTGVATGVFILYSVALLFYHFHPRSGTLTLPTLFLDLIFLLSLVLWGTSGVSAGLAAAFYAFLVLEGWAAHGGREVILLATALSLVAHGARFTAGRVAPLVVTAHSVLFLLVVGGILAFVFSDQRYLVERRILSIGQRINGASESATVAAI